MSRCNSRSSTTERELSDPIPVDLLIDMFSRLPARSIARFRCVSKFWVSIFGRPDFTELFLTKSSSRPRILFAFQAEDKLFFYSTDQPDENSCLVATPYGNYSSKGFESLTCRPLSRFVSFQGYRRSMICNPVTGESLTLPIVETEYCKKFSYSYLGYDPMDKKFKLLQITNRVFHTSDVEHRVLTLESGKQHLWRTIQYCKPYYPKYPGICIDGVLYYHAAVDKSRTVSTIVCFDIRSEKFRFINTDQRMVIELHSTLINYKGKLGILRFQSTNDYERILELWFLEDAGKHKWSKHIYVVPLTSESGDLQIVGMTRSGEIVFSSYKLSNPFYMFYYNFERNILKTVRIKGLEAFKYHSFQICPEYVEDFKLIC